jgi:uncharacterized membrane protein YdbT with pleckstrin-like domain
MEDGERIKFTISRKLYIPIYLMITILIVLIVFVKLNNLPLHQLALPGTAVFILIGIGLTELHRIRDTYYITPEHIEHISGYIAKDIKKILTKTITDIHSRQKAWQRLLNYGSIRVVSSSGSNHIDVRNINNPGKFINTLEKRMEERGKA